LVIQAYKDIPFVLNLEKSNTGFRAVLQKGDFRYLVFLLDLKMAPLLIELHFIPCLEYICLMLAHQKVHLEAQESYIKGSYRNKTRIITANGVQTLSVPLVKGKHQQNWILQ